MGGGRYATDDPGSGRAEVAFVTGGNYRGLGIASHILRHLVRIAQDAGVAHFEADVLAENEQMLAVFRRSGLPMQLRRDGSVLHVTLALLPDSNGFSETSIIGLHGIEAEASDQDGFEAYPLVARSGHRPTRLRSAIDPQRTLRRLGLRSER